MPCGMARAGERASACQGERGPQGQFPPQTPLDNRGQGMFPQDIELDDP